MRSGTSMFKAIRRGYTLIEVLIPDFRGDLDLLRVVVDAKPDVLAHNVECTEGLTARVRDARAGYRQSLDVLRAVKAMDPARTTKSSIMVGLGETEDEVIETMRLVREASVDFLTLGQYLRPSMTHLAVKEFVTPESFERLGKAGEAMGFKYVASGPLVRSSYKAGEFYIEEFLRKRNVSGADA